MALPLEELKKYFKPPINTDEINNNFLKLLCHLEALMMTLNLSESQRKEYDELSKQIYEESLSRLNEGRKAAK